MNLKENLSTIDINNEVPQKVVDIVMLKNNLKNKINKAIEDKKMKKNIKETLVFNGEDFESDNTLKSSVSEYNEASHVKVDFQNTGYLDEGILYLDDNAGDIGEFSINWVDDQGVSSIVNIRLSVNEPGVVYVNDKRISLTENRSKRVSGRFSKKDIKEDCEDFERVDGSVNNYKKSLGNFLLNHRKEMNSARSVEDLIDLVSQAENGNNNSYISEVLETLSSKRNLTIATKYLWDIILAGDKLKAIR